MYTDRMMKQVIGETTRAIGAKGNLTIKSARKELAEKIKLNKELLRGEEAYLNNATTLSMNDPSRTGKVKGYKEDIAWRKGFIKACEDAYKDPERYF